MRLDTALSFHTDRNIPPLTGGQQKERQQWIKKLMILCSSQGERGRDRWRTTYSRESTTNNLILGNVQLGSLTTIQPVGGCKNVAEGIVTGSNWEQTSVLDTSFERKWASCHLPNCEMMAIYNLIVKVCCAAVNLSAAHGIIITYKLHVGSIFWPLIKWMETFYYERWRNYSSISWYVSLPLLYIHTFCWFCGRVCLNLLCN